MMEDRVIDRARRDEVHGNPALLHRVVHVLVFDSRGRIFLQKRAEGKDVQPGKWDSSVGGHVDAGEEREAAVRRELSEELDIPGRGIPGRGIPGRGIPGRGIPGRGIPGRDIPGRGIPGAGVSPPPLQFLHRYRHGSDYESELVTTWMLLGDGPFRLQESEISDGRFWDLEDIDLLTGGGADAGPFTPNFLDELRRWREAGSPLP